MQRRLPSITFCALVLAGGGPSLAMDRSENRPARQAGISESAPSLAPFQHVRFCIRNPMECQRVGADRRQLPWSSDLSRQLVVVNDAVNASIRPRIKPYRSSLAFGWELAPSEGDCNDYAVTKRHELMSKGLPSSALRLAVVRTPSGQGHLVLVVSTTRGDLVLDNLAPAIRHWSETHYSWLKIQSGVNPRLWHVAMVPAVPDQSARDRLGFGS